MVKNGSLFLKKVIQFSFSVWFVSVFVVFQVPAKALSADWPEVAAASARAQSERYPR